MANTPEAKVKNRVKNMLNDFDAYWFMPATGGYGSSGVPDIIACAFGKFLAIECKAGNNTPTALQHREMENIIKAGGSALVINENNIDHLAVLLAAWKGEHGNTI
jgi:Holliday junction resolvase